MIPENQKFEAYFESFYPSMVQDSFRSLKIHHWIPLVTINDNNNYLFSPDLCIIHDFTALAMPFTFFY